MSSPKVIREQAKLIVDLYMSWQDGEAVVDWRKVSDINKYEFAKLFLQDDDFDYGDILHGDINLNAALFSALTNPDLDNKVEFATRFMNRCVEYYDVWMQEAVDEVLQDITNKESIASHCPQTGETTWK